MPTFWELLKDEDKIKLINLQWKLYRTRLDVMIGEKPVEVRPSAPYDLSLEQIDKEMRRPPEHQRRVV